MKPLRKLLLTTAFVVLATPAAHAECEVSCGGDGAVKVDLQSRCMCVSDGTCFKIDIGKDGPQMTTQGHGIIGEAQGAKYQTKPGPGTTGYDNDALDTGIDENTAVGKWIHKTRGCGGGGRNATKGCIAVPCEHWPLIKEEKGKSLDICGGKAPMSRNSGRPAHVSRRGMKPGAESAESDYDGDGGGGGQQ